MSKRWMKSNRHRHHSACAFGRLSRRLRAELLEGRMMLSAAPVTSVTPDFSDGIYTLRLRADFPDTVWTLKHPIHGIAIEGGYVADSVFTASVATRATRSHFDSDVTMGDLLEMPTPLYTGGFEVWTEFDWSSETGYVPQVFDSPAVESGPSPAVQPTSDDAGGGASHEGGAISIQWPTAPIDPGVEPKQPEPSLAALLMNSQDSAYAQKPAISNRMTSSAPAVSGEWARAAVFEIAGGEPLAENAPSRDERLQPGDSTSDHSAPESSNMSDAKSNSLRKGLDAAQVLVDSASANEVELTDATARETLAALDDAALFDLTSIALLDQHAATMNGGVSQVSANSDDALSAAFDQLGGDDLAVASTLSDRVRVNWLSGTPLLLMFALERVTARKSRNRQTNIVGEERPRE
jgi:hypothetical protein